MTIPAGYPWGPNPTVPVQFKVVYGKVKAGPAVGTAAGEVLQTKKAFLWLNTCVCKALRTCDVRMTLRGRSVSGSIMPSGSPATKKGVRESDFFRDRSRRSNKAGAGL